MLKKRVGDFHLTVSDPYPMWIAIECGGVTLRFPHRVLTDLEYIVTCARAEVRTLDKLAHQRTGDAE